MKKIIFIFLLPVIFLLNSCNGTGTVSVFGFSRINIEKGKGSLSAEDIKSGKRLNLQGEYEFYPWKLYSPDDFQKGVPGEYRDYIQVPGPWGLSVKGKSGLSRGFATYRLFLSTGINDELTLNLGHPGSSYRLWINGIYRGGAGEVGQSREKCIPARISRVYDFYPKDGSTEIVLQVANFHYVKGGIFDSVYIGMKERMHYSHLVHLSFDLFVFAIFLIVALYNLAIFFLRRKEKAAFWFGSFTLIVGIRAMLVNRVYISVIFPGLSWEFIRTVEFLTVSLSLPVFIQFLKYLFTGSVNRYILKFFWSVSIIYSVLILTTPAHVYSRGLIVFHVLYLLAGLYCSYIFVISAVRRMEGAVIAFIGFLFIFLAAINDILVANSVMPGILIAQFGFIIFVLAHSLNLTNRFSRAFGKNEELSETLERKVKERTRELEQERNRFKTRTEVMERELTLARRIQEQLIPHPYPSANISSMYKPMEQVGGDFYDFLKFRNSKKIGIFLSDVSGHGVPAAFITSMVKTLILQSGPRREDPAELLAFLNRLLINQTGGNFITALYCILDPDTRILQFSNAGHHAPIAITEKSVYPINGMRSIPLAVMDNDVLEKAGKMFSNSQVTLEAGSKLILYTDGLTETTEKDDTSVYFEDEILYDTLQDIRQFSSKKFVEELISSLITFHGDNSFDDDICLICVDVE